jgi:hypothetical protein
MQTSFLIVVASCDKAGPPDQPGAPGRALRAGRSGSISHPGFTAGRGMFTNSAIGIAAASKGPGRARSPTVSSR